MSNLPIALHGTVEQIDALRDVYDDLENLICRVSPTVLMVSRNSPYLEALCGSEYLTHDEPLKWDFRFAKRTEDDSRRRVIRYEIVPIYLRGEEGGS